MHISYGRYHEDSNYKNGTSTASTLSDLDFDAQFGHPLERMDQVVDTNALVRVYPPTTSAAEYIDFDSLAESMDQMEICPYLARDNYITANLSISGTNYDFMVKILPRTSEELRLLEGLNDPTLRADPWNPAPYFLSTFNRDDTNVYACFEQLMPFDQPPLLTVAHYIDFFGQLLEGLTFLHELCIVNLKCAKRTSFMVDLSAGSPSTSTEFSGSLMATSSQLCTAHSHRSHESHPTSPPLIGPTYPASSVIAPESATNSSPAFDRTKFPVKYYIVDYSNAIQLLPSSTSSASRCDEDQSQKNCHLTSCPYSRDVRDLGILFSDLLDEVPEQASNFRPLISAMMTGESTADGTRILFEALCRNLDPSVFDISITPLRPATSSGSNCTG